MRKKQFVFGVLLAAAVSMPMHAVPVNVARKTVQIAAKQSVRVLTPGARIAMEEAATKAFAQYGDDVANARNRRVGCAQIAH